jgi:conjugal transfer/entry exclusion protein
MPHIFSWLGTYHTQILAGGFFVLQGTTLILLLVVARRVGAVKQQIQSITAQVEHYMKVVLDTEETPEGETSGQLPAKAQREEEENRLISAVLREIFP